MSLRKPKKDFQATVLSEKRVSEDKMLLLERRNVKANKAAKEAKYNSVITHHALNNTLQQLEHMQIRNSSWKKLRYSYKKNRSIHYKQRLSHQLFLNSFLVRSHNHS